MIPLLLTLCASPALAEPTPVPSTIREVTVYGANAMVRRVAELPGEGTFVLRGLTRALDPESVRVRCEGGDVVDVEIRDRLQEAAANERVQALRAELERLRLELGALQDEKAVAEELLAHLSGMLRVERETFQREVQSGRPSPESWRQSFDFVAERMTATRTALREVVVRVRAKNAEIERVMEALGRIGQGQNVPVRDVHVDVVASGAGAIRLTVDYGVHAAGWQPVYDLRTAADLSGVELVYRARVWQRTGEDWDNVRLMLSTAQPQLGAQGPEPHLTWLELFDPTQRKRVAGARVQALGYADEAEGRALGEPELAAAAPFASVRQEGLSLRYEVARPETVESRDEPTVVLVGRASLGVRPERYCVPARDTNVWLRAEARNSSEWALLPGRAAVFFGNDFLGHAQIETVQPGQDLTLHLGADPGLSVERTLVEDVHKEPGFLSSRSARVERWRLHLENHGTVGAHPDGSVEVIVRESVPRARDDRISVELSNAQPPFSKDARWQQDREEKSIYTWVVRVPRDETGTDVVIESTIEFPKGLEVRRR